MSGKLSECQENCQNVRKIVRMSGKLSECQENCQNVRKTVRIFNAYNNYNKIYILFFLNLNQILN